MKRVLFILAFIGFTFTSVSAQNVYSEIKRLSEAVANDQTKDIETRKIATFKVDELNYMAAKSAELMPDSSMRMLDYQAYAMYEYVNLFLDKLTKAEKKTDKDEVKEIFKVASINNSRFNDMDKELVLAYYLNPNYITQFSLDTDWVKALRDVKESLGIE